MNETTWVDEPFSARFYVTVNSPSQQFNLSIEGNKEIDLKRILGCVILTNLPEKALDESLRALKDIHDFYFFTPSISERTPVRTFAGRIIEEKKRPDLVIED